MKIQSRRNRAGLRAGVITPHQINRQRGGFLLAVLLLAIGASQAVASDPVGIYSFVDKVVFEPDAQSPQRVQIWGGFALAAGRGETYTDAKRGYMYFEAAPGKESVSRKEWNDLQKIAGSGNIVAFGSRFRPTGTIRTAEDKPAKPDPYPIEMGLVKITDSSEPSPRANYKPIKELQALQKTKDAPKNSAAEQKSKS